VLYASLHVNYLTVYDRHCSLFFSSMWFVCLVAWIEVILLSSGSDFSFKFTIKHKIFIRCMCVYTRACVQKKGKKTRRKWQPFLLRTLCECRTTRLISEYLWVIAGGKKKEKKKNEKKRTTRRMPGFFLYIPSFFSVVVPFLPPLCQYNTTLSRRTLVRYANYA
jgi:hypothetical protein